MQNAKDFRQAVCESRDSDRIVKFLTGDEFTEEMQARLSNSQIWGVYYDEDNHLVAEDIWQEVHKGILA